MIRPPPNFIPTTTRFPAPTRFRVYMFQKDRYYIVKDGKVVIIDEFTGRMMEGRRYSEGLHQAIEAKERVDIQRENPTLASITIQNYFRLYPKLGGMTGTAMTEAAEFAEIYGLAVVEVQNKARKSGVKGRGVPVSDE